MTTTLRKLHLCKLKNNTLLHGSSQPPPPESHPNIRGDLKISDSNNWGRPEQKLKLEGELNLRVDLKS